MADKRRFDRAEITEESGEITDLSWDEFWALPLTKRVGSISKGTVKFFLVGRPIGPKEAIQR